MSQDKHTSNIQIPGIVGFRLCTLTDTELAHAISEHMKHMYRQGGSFQAPPRHVPARPDEDFDLLVGEMIVRFMDNCNALTELREQMDRKLEHMRKNYSIEAAEVASFVIGDVQRFIASKLVQP